MKKLIAIIVLSFTTFSCGLYRAVSPSYRTSSDAQYHIERFKVVTWEDKKLFHLLQAKKNCEEAKGLNVQVAACSSFNVDDEINKFRLKYCASKDNCKTIVIANSQVAFAIQKAGLYPHRNPYMRAYAIVGSVFNLEKVVSIIFRTFLFQSSI